MSARSLDISKSKCPKLEKSYDKKKYYMSKDKKGLMSTQEDLDDTTSEKEGEEVNICLMVDTISEELESKQEEVDLNGSESLKQV